MHAFNPSTREAEANGSLSSRPAWLTEWVPGQPGLHRELSQTTTIWPQPSFPAQPLSLPPTNRQEGGHTPSFSGLYCPLSSKAFSPPLRAKWSFPIFQSCSAHPFPKRLTPGTNYLWCNYLLSNTTSSSGQIMIYFIFVFHTFSSLPQSVIW